MITHGVEVARDGQNVERLDKGIVEQEHDCCEVPGDSGVPEEHLSNIANISHLGMTQAKLPVASQYHCPAEGVSTHQTMSEV